MPYKTTYKPGDWNVICDLCGFKKKRSECKKTWDNRIVCADTCYEPRHPLDFPARPRVDRQTVKDARPEGTDQYVDVSWTDQLEWDSALD